jgi:hypothetical protein
MTCSNKICMDNFVTGAVLNVQAPDGPQEFFGDVIREGKFTFENWFPNLIGGGPPGVITAVQHMPRCGLSSGKANSEPIQKLTSFNKPKGIPPCADQSQLQVQGLTVGAQLKINRVVGANTGHPIGIGDPTQTRITPIGHESFSYPLPKSWALTDPAGEVSFILTQQGRGSCAVAGLASDPVPVIATPFKPGDPAPAIKLIPDPAYVCSRTLVVSDLTVGASVSIERADGQVLFNWALITDSTMPITLPLRLGLLPKNAETIVAREKGCTTSLTSNPIRVVKYPADRLPTPGFATPPRSYLSYVTFTGLVPGVRVYVMVDGSRFTPSGGEWSGDV